ncbi:hypothetical protein [uncultured Jatrophihabitans sp.]|uniref:hypothetical protein n=1 Tax=uncultured Jatrophihabitans sp. TaxID=1610747 RepID=UPI0035CB6B4D
MISAVAFCPQAPVLVPGVAQGAAGELDDLRTACRTAIRRLVAPGRQLVVLGDGAANARFASTSRGTFAGFGLDLAVSLGSDEPGPVDLPPSLTVGAWLLRDALGPNCGAVGYSIADPSEIDDHWDGGDLGLLVLGDGSARRSVKAPGYFDERAEAFDARIARALADGDPDQLHLWQAGDAAALLATCAAAYELTARAAGGTLWHAELLYDDAPYGVGYFVASWTARG